MRNILFEPRPLPPRLSGQPPTMAPQRSRRLLSITIALQLSGAPPPTNAALLLLARYVAGRVSLAEVLPVLWPG